MEFYKMQANGNDFIITLNDETIPYNIKSLCDYHYGIGANGLINIDKHFNVSIYNADGSKANICGNGLRCLCKLLYILTKKDSFTFKLDKTEVKAKQINDNTSSLLMPTPMMIKKDDGYFVNILNNHYILIVDDINKFSFNDELKDYSYKNNCNVHVLSIINRNKIKIKTYEYGVKETLSCGSGALASFYALFMLGKVNEEVEVISLGGSLTCSYKNNNYYLKGDSKLVYKGGYYGI